MKRLNLWALSLSLYEEMDSLLPTQSPHTGEGRLSAGPATRIKPSHGWPDLTLVGGSIEGGIEQPSSVLPCTVPNRPLYLVDFGCKRTSLVDMDTVRTASAWTAVRCPLQDMEYVHSDSHRPMGRHLPMGRHRTMGRHRPMGGHLPMGSIVPWEGIVPWVEKSILSHHFC